MKLLLNFISYLEIQEGNLGLSNWPMQSHPDTIFQLSLKLSWSHQYVLPLRSLSFITDAKKDLATCSSFAKPIEPAAICSNLSAIFSLHIFERQIWRLLLTTQRNGSEVFTVDEKYVVLHVYLTISFLDLGVSCSLSNMCIYLLQMNKDSSL